LLGSLLRRVQQPHYTHATVAIALFVTWVTSLLPPQCDKRDKWKANRAF
jgi:hypothetical protein